MESNCYHLILCYAWTTAMLSFEACQNITYIGNSLSFTARPKLWPVCQISKMVGLYMQELHSRSCSWKWATIFGVAQKHQGPLCSSLGLASVMTAALCIWVEILFPNSCPVAQAWLAFSGIGLSLWNSLNSNCANLCTRNIQRNFRCFILELLEIHVLVFLRGTWKELYKFSNICSMHILKLLNKSMLGHIIALWCLVSCMRFDILTALRLWWLLVITHWLPVMLQKSWRLQEKFQHWFLLKTQRTKPKV